MKAPVKAKRAPDVQKKESAVNKKRASSSRGGKKKKRHKEDVSDDTRSTASESSSSSDDDYEAPVRNKRKRTVSGIIRGNSEGADFAHGNGGDWRVAGAFDR